MSDVEYDYMSDEILGQCTKDIRPGLIHDRSKQRLIAIEKRKCVSDEENKKRHKSQASLEAETREKGLQEAIPADNKGFELLQKMGYKPGEALGKTVKGLLNPVQIEVKGDRAGLGRKSAIKLKLEAKQRLEGKGESAKEIELKTQDFRKRMTSDAMRRYAEMDLVSSQRACYNLDTENGHEKPVKEWYWPGAVMGKVEEPITDDDDQEHSAQLKKKEEGQESEDADSDEEDEEELTTEEKLVELTGYLRNTYFYCVWCGATFTGKEDIDDYCPGSSREEH